MKTQRYKIFEPHILPVKSEFFLICGNELFGQKLQIGLSNDKKYIDKSSKEEPFLKFINVGLGIAKDISINISYDINYAEHFKFLKEKLESVSPDIKIMPIDSSCWIEEKKKDETVFASSFPYQLKTEKNIDYLPPVKDSNEIFKINIPTSVVSAISLTTILFNHNINERNPEFFERLIDGLKIKIDIKYKDNLNKLHKENFVLILERPDIEFNSTKGNMIYTIKFTREQKYFA